jgi:hypothetical protein
MPFYDLGRYAFFRTALLKVFFGNQIWVIDPEILSPYFLILSSSFSQVVSRPFHQKKRLRDIFYTRYYDPLEKRSPNRFTISGITPCGLQADLGLQSLTLAG